MKQIALASLCAVVAAGGAALSVHLWRQALEVGNSSSSGAGVPAAQQRSLLSSFAPAAGGTTLAPRVLRVTTSRFPLVVLGPRPVATTGTRISTLPARPRPRSQPRGTPRPTPKPTPSPAPSPAPSAQPSSPPPAVPPPPPTRATPASSATFARVSP